MTGWSKKFTDSTSKKEECLTYKKLSLSREHKSKAGRRRTEDSRLYLYIGKGTLDQPYLKVLRSEYLRIWKMIDIEIAQEYAATSFSREQLAAFKQNILPKKVYDDFLRRLDVMTHVEVSFKKEYGRDMTPHEQKIYSNTLDQSLSTCEASPQKRALNLRRYWFNDLFQKIESHQQEKSKNLQHIWGTLVGPEIAHEVLLEKVDAKREIAVCRCLNPSLSFQLRRRRDLPEKLSALLHCKISRVVFT